MYIPKLYHEEEREEILSFMRQNNFAILVTFDGQRPVATHAPVEIVEDEQGGLTISGHISAANPQRESFDGREALLIFQGPHTYISPRWYNHVNVPTWNYMAAHLYGPVRAVEGEALRALLSRLVQQHEGGSSYRLEGLPEDFVMKQMSGIIGFEISVTRVEASYKLSQNRGAEDHANIIRELEQRGDEPSRQVAGAMRRRAPKA